MIGDAGSRDRSSFDVDADYTSRNRVGLVLGPMMFVLILVLPTPTGLSIGGQVVAATGLWMAIWWVSEAVPIPATALLPLVVFPVTGTTDPQAAATPYANRLVFLFLGGFLVAVSIERWGLHRRIALKTILFVGSAPRRLIGGFMLATAFLSMWISNTATALMMTPIGLAVVAQTVDLLDQRDLDIRTGEGEFRFGTTLMLSIAYAASIGGVATLIGSPPNIIFAGYVAEVYGEEISFSQWARYGIPLAIVGLAIAWLYLTRIILETRDLRIPIDEETIETRLQVLGPMSSGEKRVLGVFAFVAIAWMSRDVLITPVLPMVDDAAIAIFGALLLFVIPVTEDGELTFLLNWSTAVSIPWGIILLFGGGLSLAAAVEVTGLGSWMGTLLLGLDHLNLALILLMLGFLAVFLTEITSNTALTAMIIPVLGALAAALTIHPFFLMVVATTVASFAFMLPVATPPNAVVFGSGYISAPQMARTGFVLNVVGTVLAVLFALFWLPIAWRIEPGTIPPWFA